MPYLLGPVQFGQVSAEIITDYRIGIRCAQERSTSLKGNLAERLEIAGRSLVIPDFTALGLLFSPRVERALLNRTKNPTSRPLRGKGWDRKSEPDKKNSQTHQIKACSLVHLINCHHNLQRSWCTTNWILLSEWSHQDMHDVVGVAQKVTFSRKPEEISDLRSDNIMSERKDKRRGAKMTQSDDTITGGWLILRLFGEESFFVKRELKMGFKVFIIDAHWSILEGQKVIKWLNIFEHLSTIANNWKQQHLMLIMLKQCSVDNSLLTISLGCWRPRCNLQWWPASPEDEKSQLRIDLRHFEKRENPSNILELIGLDGKPLSNCQDGRTWLSQVSDFKARVHWGGSEAAVQPQNNLWQNWWESF